MLRRRLLRDLLLGGWNVPGSLLAAPTGRVSGTFLQLGPWQQAWSDDRWHILFSALRQLRASNIIVQWSVLGDTAFYASQLFRNSTGALDRVFHFSAESNIQVMLGLASDTLFWQTLDSDPPLVQVFLDRQLLRSKTVAKELFDRYGTHPSFHGWYISEEIDDVHWRGSTRRALVRYLTNLCQALRSLSPGGPISISGFAQGRLSPTAFTELWAELLATGLDTIWFQDGIGVGKLDFTTLPIYLTALQSATRPTSRDLRVVVEVFEQLQDPARPQSTFHAGPAAFSRVRRQIELAAQFDASPVIFSLAEYMCNLGGPKASELLSRYLDWQHL